MLTESGVQIKQKVSARGSYEWRDDQERFHREDGPAFRSAQQGADAYFKHGQLHRVDGPAISFDDQEGKIWAIEGELFHIEELWLERRDQWLRENNHPPIPREAA